MYKIFWGLKIVTSRSRLWQMFSDNVLHFCGNTSGEFLIDVQIRVISLSGFTRQFFNMTCTQNSFITLFSWTCIVETLIKIIIKMYIGWLSPKFHNHNLALYCWLHENLYNYIPFEVEHWMPLFADRPWPNDQCMAEQSHNLSHTTTARIIINF